MWSGNQRFLVIYQGVRIEMGFRADLIVEDKVIVEIKSVETVAPVHKKQLPTHLATGGHAVGTAQPFQCCADQIGITRMARGMPD